jgi:hypothetical protein
MFAFLVSRKSGLIKSCFSSEYLSQYKTVWSYVNWCKFCIHLTSLNIRHFGMVAVTALKLWLRGHLQWHDLPTEFHNNLRNDSKVIGDRYTDRMVIILAYTFALGRTVC